MQNIVNFAFFFGVKKEGYFQGAALLGGPIFLLSSARRFRAPKEGRL